MRAVVQRVKNTKLFVDEKLISEIDFGLTVFLGVTTDDTEKEADYIAKKCEATPVFVPMQYSKDKKISEEIIKNMETKAVFVDKVLSVPEIMGIVSKSSFAIASLS